jgi:large subunit ribosomal protein L29
MPILRTKEIRQMKPEDLNKKLSELRLELMKEVGNMKMGKASKNTNKIKQLKKAIAKILTIKSSGGKK